MKIIVIAGKAKGVGKTTLASYIIRNLKCRVGAVKTSIHDDPGDNIVTDDPDIINAEGTDTSIFVSSGADRVIYLASDDEHLHDSLDKAKGLIGNEDYLVIEGNRVLDYLKAALTIYIARKGVETKASAVRAKARADIIIDADDLFSILSKESTAKEIPFVVNINHIPCYKAHLIAHALGMTIFRIGKIIDEQGIKVTHCQLGLF
ncbi:MAG: hypothetical protein J7K51_10070 [Thermotogae bacterium]|nr:hypothetical protein [Thermotogota bacterium]